MRGILRRDELWLGIVIGFLAPILGLFIYYYIQFRVFTIKEFFQVILTNKSLLTGIISISLIANAIVFTIYINAHHDRTARGVFIATCIYAILSLLVKMFA